MTAPQTITLFIVRPDAPATKTASFRMGEPHDYGWAKEGIFFIKVTAVSGTDPTLDIKVEISPNDEDWADEGTTIPTITSPGLYFCKVRNFGNFMTLYGTIGGITPSFTFWIVFVGKT